MLKLSSRLSLTLLLLLGAAPFVKARDFEYTQAMKKETQTVVFLLENFHYAQKFINQSQAEELIEGFMEDLDYNHVFFLKQDREEMVSKYASRLERSLRRGELEAAYDIYQRYEERFLSRIDWVLERLTGGFDFEEETEYVVDREEFPWLESVEVADELWEKRLKYEMLFDILNDEEQTDAVETINKRYERLKKNLLDLESSDIQEIFLTTLTQMFDPHSTFLSSDTLEDFSISMSLSLVGIGAILVQEEGYCTIRELIPGGPADLDGRMRAGDKIVLVAQKGEEPVDVIDMGLRKIVKMIRGEKATTVLLTVIPADAADPSSREVIDIVRDEVQITASRASANVFQLPINEKEELPIGVIQLPSFYGDLSIEEGGTPTSTTKDVAELIAKLQEQNIRGLILDLRNNGGGLLTEAIDLTGLFIKTGPVVQVRNSRGFIRRDWDRDEDIAYGGPLIVLVSRYSASASEIVAGALQYYDRALIVGDKSTHGKGTVQAVYEIDKLASPSFFNDQPTGAAKLTIQKFYLPNGRSTQNKGVISDIALPSINEFLKIGEADLDHSMLWDEIKPVNWSKKASELKFDPIDELLKTQLTRLSEARQNELEEFAFLKESIEFFKEKQELKSYSLNLAKRKEQKETDKEFRDLLESRQTELKKLNFISTEITLNEVEVAKATENSTDSVHVDNPPSTVSSLIEPTKELANSNKEFQPELGEINNTLSGPEIALNETPLDDSSEKGDNDSTEKGPSIDIHLRETLRILSDWIHAQDPEVKDTAANHGVAEVKSKS
ncbi:MAG: carboxy terminal-processing peptidase [Verrucomicrobia bacterium]|nr:carboxy terminal-processing peptidase [Verrucomicrobiota bacterium]MDA1065190.1 carboxy terminal-processing peptidase [Verrucomicrobiota bacterium]